MLRLQIAEALDLDTVVEGHATCLDINDKLDMQHYRHPYNALRVCDSQRDRLVEYTSDLQVKPIKLRPNHNPPRESLHLLLVPT